MAEPQFPDPVKLFVAILFAEAMRLAEAIPELERLYSPVDFHGPDRPFDVTDYYESEMGPGLRRRIVAFRDLVSPEVLIEAKLTCNRLEDQLRTAQGRGLNLDVGYLDHNKIVLASAKGAGQKIYLGKGIHGDLAGRYAKGRYQPFEWSFPDFRDGRYDPELTELRRQYLEQLRARGR